MRFSIVVTITSILLSVGRAAPSFNVSQSSPVSTRLTPSPNTPTAGSKKAAVIGSSTPVTPNFDPEDWEEVYDDFDSDGTVARSATNIKKGLHCRKIERNKSFPRTFGTISPTGESSTMTPTELIFEQFRENICNNNCKKLPNYPANIHAASRVGTTGCTMALLISPWEEIFVSASDTTDREECNTRIDDLMYECWGRGRREKGRSNFKGVSYGLGKQEANDPHFPHDTLNNGLHQFAPHFNARCQYDVIFQHGSTIIPFELEVGIPDDQFADTWIAQLQRSLQCNDRMVPCAVQDFIVEPNQDPELRFQDGSMIQYRVSFTGSGNHRSQTIERKINEAFNLPEYAIGCRYKKPFFFDNISSCARTNGVCPYPPCFDKSNGIPWFPWDPICEDEDLPPP